MKLKSFLFAVSFSLFSTVFAANVHMHPKVEGADTKSVSKGLTYPGYCQIEIINDSSEVALVLGTFDDNSTVNFYISPNYFERTHYLDLYYYGYCHSGLYLTINLPYRTVYSGWVNTDSSLRLVPGFGKNVTAQLSVR